MNRKNLLMFILLVICQVVIKANVQADTLKPGHLPLVITSSHINGSDKPVALIISGDGGWYHFEQSIADDLARQGIPTIGLDARRYFWKRRTPEEATSDLTNALVYYCREWKRSRIILIGYSLGAEIVPFIVNRFSDVIRARVESIVLLSPDVSTDFEIHLSNMMGLGNHQNTYNTVEEINRLHNVPALLIFGDGEKTKVPELVSGPSVKIKKIPGDHHYKFNVPLIMKTMTDNKSF